jgi:hypothetical protein
VCAKRLAVKAIEITKVEFGGAEDR